MEAGPAEWRSGGRWALGLILLLACAGPRQNVDSAPRQESDAFSLILNSHHLLDVNVFVQHDGQADRVGMVPASSSKTLVLPLWMLGQSGAIRIIVEPIGDETRYTTDLLTVQPGQAVVLNVESTITRSNYAIQ